MGIPERLIPFVVSPTSAAIGRPPLDSAAFKASLLGVPKTELTGYLRSYVRDRVPAAFLEKTMLWEALREWAAIRLEVKPFEIGVSGSAQVGFSCAPDRYGEPFSPTRSDLDLFVVSELLFSKLIAEVHHFVSNPSKSFSDQKETLQRTLQRGFIDLKHIPPLHEKYPNCASINNWSSMIVDKLLRHDMKLSRSYFRVYSSWDALYRQTLINLKALQGQLFKR